MKRMALLLAFVFIAANSSFAAGVNMHRFGFSNTLETLGIEDALGADSELARRQFLLRLSYDYVQDPTLGSNTDRPSIPEVIRDMHSYQLGFGTMASKRLFLGFNVPMHKTEAYGSESETSLGDISAMAKWRLTGDNAPINFALVPFFSLPTGDAELNNSDDDTSYGMKLAFDKALGAFKLFLNLGYRHAPEGYVAGANFDRTNVATGAFGVFYRVNNWLGFNAEYSRDHGLDGGAFRSPQDVRASARITYKNTHFFVGSGVESARGFTNQDFNIYAGVKMGFGTVCGADCAKACCKKPAAPAPKPVDKVSVLKKNLSVKREIGFKTSSSTILSSSYPSLDSAAAVISKYQDQIGSVTVEGHTDSAGRALGNKRLSQKRANAVKAYLVSKGVSASKISAVGYGEERLKVSPEKNAADRKANRRVEFKVNETIKVKK